LKNKTIEIRRITPMTDILKRDITGECEGECRDLVREGEEERQDEILASDVETPEEYPNAKWAKSRNEQPGVWGGHV
jgi:c-di-GMP-related signal transduction protein